MIGGDDHILEWRDTPVLRWHLERYSKALWSGCVVIKDGATWFVHQNFWSVIAWNARGGTDENQATMFALYFGDRLTVVTAPRSSIALEISGNLDANQMFQGFERS